MADNSPPNEGNKTTWQQRGTRLDPDEAAAWDKLMADEKLVTAEVIRRFCWRFMRDADVRKQFS